MDFPLNFKILLGTYLVVRWLKHRTSTAQGTIPSLVSVWELRSHKPCSMAKVKKKKKKKKNSFFHTEIKDLRADSALRPSIG